MAQLPSRTISGDTITNNNIPSTELSDNESIQQIKNAEIIPNKTVWQKIISLFGFSKTYNFILFFIFAGAMLVFSLARMEYLAVGTNYKAGASPGEWFWYRQGHYRIGITLHLVTVIPAAFLMVWQFVPKIRKHFMIFHRINGYIVVTLLLLGNIGALMIARRAFGGTLAVQTAVGTLVIITTLGMAMAIYNIKCLQIEQHRAWMLRTMFWMGTIITVRLIMIICALVISKIGSYYTVFSCAEVGSLFDSEAAMSANYPQCFLVNGTTDDMVAVNANMAAIRGAAEVGSSLRLGFGAGMWLAIFLHTIGVEIYLRLTPREHERLRMVSYERQKAAGFKHPGSAGLTVDRWGDAEAWVPAK